jgi:hypothetical protein
MNGKAVEGSGNGVTEDYPSICMEGLRETAEKPL